MPAISAGIRHRLARFIPPDVRLRRPEPYRPIVHFPARCGNACSPNAKMLEKPEHGNSWPPISAKGATRAASAELPHRCSPAVLML